MKRFQKTEHAKGFQRKMYEYKTVTGNDVLIELHSGRSKIIFPTNYNLMQRPIATTEASLLNTPVMQSTSNAELSGLNNALSGMPTTSKHPSTPS